jgi:L-fucose mutarotase/ribose pyranase (RbsD/FucU family)
MANYGTPPYRKEDVRPWEDAGLMLKTLTRLHTLDLLHVLASMGHGDELALVDCRFPAVSNARRLVRLDGADLPDTLSACLQLMLLDTFVKDAALRMEVADSPDPTPEVRKICQEVIDKWEGVSAAPVRFGLHRRRACGYGSPR